MTDDFQAVLIQRFRLQKPHLETEAEQHRAMLALIASVYASCKPEEVVGAGNKIGGSFFFGRSKPKSKTLKDQLAGSLRDIAANAAATAAGTGDGSNPGTPVVVERRLSLTRHTSSDTPSPIGSGGTFTPRSRTRKNSKDVLSSRRPELTIPWRQSLFKAVSASLPRTQTPGRKSSQAMLFMHEQSPAPPTRRSQVLARWQKAVRQQMMLLRMAKQNAKLEQTASAEALQRKRASDATMSKGWAALWRMEVTEWDQAELARCIGLGVPAEVRRRVWLSIVSRFSPASLPGETYVNLLIQPCIYRHAIRLDLGRTFPDDPLYAEEGGVGQSYLYNCMAAYANLDEEVGYCQGLSFVAGLLLTQLNEEDAFFVLSRLLFEHGIRSQYMPDMSQLQVQLYQFSRLLHDTWVISAIKCVYDFLYTIQASWVVFITSAGSLMEASKSPDPGHGNIKRCALPIESLVY